MSGNGITVAVLGLISGLAINEMSDVSPWLARVVIRKSAHLRYGDTPRAEVRAEELQALVTDDRPGKLLKLITALGFLVRAIPAWLRRELTVQPYAEDADEVDPSDLVAMRLFPTERYRGEWTHHWIRPVKSIAAAAAIATLAVVAAFRQWDGTLETVAVTVIPVLFVLRAGHRVLDWRFARFVITNKRLMVTSGVLSRRVSMLPLLRVTDMKYTQSMTGRLLDYGTFTLESAGRGRGMRSVKDIPNPSEIYLRVVEEMYEPAAVEARLGIDEAPAELRQRLIDHLEHLPERQLKALAALLDLDEDDDPEELDE
ncbi:PH domain-containing protein [Actinoplanes palleronii]|uniref:YdbS-like PH domain-containing protein n=1 Tax=Actinoplanes palleronii TaxID=113570 RepID=A0ABQ4B908_9ACTN|nr:PH domain-containing protein [Actinoplanes palleronii]GIE67192.1 hypothetical protein Apa02nite_033000 [Actinoplanes palleronii]